MQLTTPGPCPPNARTARAAATAARTRARDTSRLVTEAGRTSAPAVGKLFLVLQRDSATDGAATARYAYVARTIHICLKES